MYPLPRQLINPRSTIAFFSLIFSALAAFTVTTATADQSPSTAAGDRPAMWQMQDDNTKITFFGTMHLLPPEAEWQSQLYRDEMASATTTITEADTDSPDAMAAIFDLVQEFGMNPPGTTLDDVLGEDLAIAMAGVAERYGVPAWQLQVMRPWLAAVTISMAAYMKAGFDPNTGVEMVVLGEAREQEDRLVYLETIREQFEFLAGLDEEESNGNVSAMLAQFEDIDDTIQSLLRSWLTGDLATQEAYLISDLRTLSPSAYEKLISGRNRDWALEFERLMSDTAGHYFVAVGALHLVGDDSVIELLRKRGYDVERIQ